MLYLVPPHRIRRLAADSSVDAMAVSTGDDRRIIGRLGPPFNFETVHPGGHQFRKMVDHAQIPGVHDIRSLFILIYREIFTGALFLHKRVFIPAGLSACAAVGIPPGHIVAQQATAGIGHAHRTVNKGLQLQRGRRLSPDSCNFFQRQFPRQDYAICPQIVPGTRRLVIDNTGLRADVLRYMRRILPGQCKHPYICHDQRINSIRLQRRQIVRQPGHLVVARHSIHRNMHAHAVGVRKAHRFLHFRFRKVPGKGTHAKGCASQIHSVGAVEHSQAQPLQIARRHEQLRHGNGKRRMRRFPCFQNLPICLCHSSSLNSSGIPGNSNARGTS